jgi:hypothetical protein
MPIASLHLITVEKDREKKREPLQQSLHNPNPWVFMAVAFLPIVVSVFSRLGSRSTRATFTGFHDDVLIAFP